MASLSPLVESCTCMYRVISPLLATRLNPPLVLGSGVHWLLAKMSVLLLLFLWFRATFPRYRYDQIMRLGWKVFIPITIVWLVVEGAAVMVDLGPWFD